MEYTVTTRSPEETEEVGRALAEKLLQKKDKNRFICLSGDLGAGKTAFVRGFASYASPGSRVKSPSYTVVNEYRGGDVPLFHFDLYRLEDADEGLYGIGFDDYVAGGHCILEWSEYLPSYLRPADAISVKIEKTENDEERRVTVTSVEDE